ncbi:hypothetical protein [Rickettsia endosymbiont of Orchestes rusci]|uniref:hypothetical protein n=1 Tax=Rickettsia endosymbiont of Orchestes rusci TaxID=3066250 RepID=UPI00313C4C28
MQLLTWKEISELTIREIAELFGVSHSHIYKYLYEEAIPQRPTMLRIVEETKGWVIPNDFYNVTPELLARLKEEALKDHLFLKKALKNPIFLAEQLKGLTKRRIIL